MSKSTPPQDLIRATLTARLATGELLTESDFRMKSGWTEAALATALTERRIFCLEHEEIRCIPAFFLDAALLQALSEIAQLLGEKSAGSKFLFLTQLNGYLALKSGASRSPLQALRDGDIEAVRRAAAGAN